MVDEGRARSRARTGALTWPVAGARRAWGAARRASNSPSRRASANGRRRRLAPAACFPGSPSPSGRDRPLFHAEREPVWVGGIALAAASAIVAVLLRRRPVGFVLALGFLAIAAGFAVATLKAALIVIRCCGIPVLCPNAQALTEIRHE